MPFVTVGRENSGEIRIHYEDHGSGPAVVLVHDYLADANAWEKQEWALLGGGYRVISYDRRGSGFSSRPASGYDYQTLAHDLRTLLDQLDISDLVLVGAGSGAGEVIRYLGTYGRRRIRGVVLLAPLAVNRSTSPAGHGAEPEFIDAFLAALADDRPAAIKMFLDLYYNLDVLGGVQVSDQAWQNSFQMAIRVSPIAAASCAAAWREDLTEDLGRMSLPVLIVQGSLDRITMAVQTGSELARALPRAELVVIADGPHAIIWTHAAEVNRELLRFVSAPEVSSLGRRAVRRLVWDLDR